MKRYLAITLLAVTIIAISLVAYKRYKPSSRITVANAGADVVEVKTDGSEKKILLGQNGIGYYDSGSKVQIGDAIISVGRRVEVANTGSNSIQVVYHDTTGSEHTTMLGEGGTGYFSKATPINIGDITISVGKAQ